MYKHLNERVIVLSYFTGEGVPEFKSTEEAQAYYCALGRLVAWGMAHGEEVGSNQLVTVALNKEDSVACYYKSLPAEVKNDAGYFHLSPSQAQITELVDHMQAGAERPNFVIGMVRHNDGTYGLHS